MDDRYTVYENQLLYALTVALLASPLGSNTMEHPAVKNCLEAIEQHYLTGKPSFQFDVSFCDFTGYLYHLVGDKRLTVATLRIDRFGRARTYRIGPAICHIIQTTDRTEQYIERKELLRGVHRIDIRSAIPCLMQTQ